MTEEILKALEGLDFDSLTARDAMLLRSALTAALERSNSWFANLAQGFDLPLSLDRAVDVRVENGRPPDPHPATPPVKTPKRRGRPVPNLKVDLKVNRPAKPAPSPLAVGGADALGAQDGPRPAQIFQESYISKEGPRPGATLPPDHPRRGQMRESSVTPEVDMSDFREAEEAMRKGTLGKVFQ